MNYIEMTEEKFAELIKRDKWISNIQYACKCCDRDGKFKYYRTVSYPTSYIVTEDQISKAQELASIRKNEILDSIKRGDLVFKAMGGSYNGKYADGVNNHRIRCNFKASNGKKYFVELIQAGEDAFWVDFSIDLDVEEGQGYGAMGVEKKTFKQPFTWENVLRFINDTYGCNYTSARLIEYLVSYEDWVCEC
jgi:hypothetical protein